MNRYALPFLMTLLSACSTARPLVPAADHHQHVFSPTMVALLDTTHTQPPITARDVIALLDSAGIRRAVVLSVAYIYSSPARTVEDEYAKVRAENDWKEAWVSCAPSSFADRK